MLRRGKGRCTSTLARRRESRGWRALGELRLRGQYACLTLFEGAPEDARCSLETESRRFVCIQSCRPSVSSTSSGSSSPRNPCSEPQRPIDAEAHRLLHHALMNEALQAGTLRDHRRPGAPMDARAGLELRPTISSNATAKPANIHVVTV